ALALDGRVARRQALRPCWRRACGASVRGRRAGDAPTERFDADVRTGRPGISRSGGGGAGFWTPARREFGARYGSSSTVQLRYGLCQAKLRHELVLVEVQMLGQ